jgi:hypothetical protein
MSIRALLGVVCALCLLSVVAYATELSMAIVDPAVAIQKSLADDSTAGVRGNAEIVEEVATNRLKPPSPEIAQAAKTLKSAANLADARTAFGKLSEAIVAYVEAQKLTLDPRFHIAFCPMVNKPWLQAGEQISNPYYGKEMPTCGSLKK